MGQRKPRGARFRKNAKQFGGRRIRQPVQFFKRTVYQPQFIQLTPGLVATGTAFSFNLSAVSNSSEFTTLYDQYQIKAVKVQLIPKHTEVIASTSVVQGNVHSVLDYDDSSTPSDLDTLLQYQNYKMTRMNKVHSRYLRPMVLHEIYRSIASTSYAPKRNTWLDVAGPGVPHFGVKFWFDALPIGAATLYYDVKTTYFLAFKNVR